MKVFWLTYLPHGNLVFSEEEEVDLSGHLGGLLHVHKVLKELLHGRDLPHVLQSLTVVDELFLLLLSRRTSLGSRVLLRVLCGKEALEVPKLPIGLKGMTLGGDERVLNLHLWLERRGSLS